MSKSSQPLDLKKKLVERMVREYDSRRSYSRSCSRDSRWSYSRSPYMSISPSRSRSYSGRSGSISPKRKYSRPSPSVFGSRFDTYNND
ncbi:hypothetical protein CMV_028954 [Castanea mollissima]|uniref:Uncharacterized protein n=1 Tax=Castanea mollissima TaxID=60419 RepID=A0A8J4V7W1_9ROSI|nr:hypothetical protein CMV_028954 [Castanea mollissima]